jgi:hypothetical protein
MSHSRRGLLKASEDVAAVPPADVIALARKKLKEKQKAQGTVLEDALAATPKGIYLDTVHKVAANRELAQSLSENPVCRAALAVVAKYVEPPMPQIAKIAKQTVVQVRQVPGGYALKTASPHYYLPQEVMLTRPALYHTIAQVYGGQAAQKTTLDVDLHGAVTTVYGDKVAEDPAEGSTPELITSFGVYRVATADGKEVVGYVFPSLIDETGKGTPVAMFVNGESMAIKPEIYGVRTGESAFMFQGRPMRGNGFFYRSKNGVSEATIPVEHLGTASGALGSGEISQVAHFQAYDGTKLKVIVEPGIEQVTALPAEGPGGSLLPTLIIPTDFRWFSLEQCRSITLADSPHAAEEQKMAAAAPHTVHVVASGNSFALRGMPVAKLAHNQREQLGKEEVVFVLGCMGVEPKLAYQKLGRALTEHAPIPCLVQTPIHRVGNPAGEKVANAARPNKCAALRVNLWKEAAFLEDETTVDSLLSVGFLNDDNVHTFISHLPDIERSVRSLSQMLFASRLGLKVIPEDPLASALKQLEKVVEGLRALAFSRGAA